MKKLKKELSQDFINKMKAKLLKEKIALEKELNLIASKNPKNKNDYMANYQDMGDDEDVNAQEVSNFSDNLSVERNLEKSLRDVNSALDRIEKKTYGKCKYCENNINPLRLKARPTSSACIKCKITLKNL